MEVDESRAQFTSTLEGVKYYFCSRSCKERFDREPRRYVKV